MRYVVKICNRCDTKKSNKSFSVNNRWPDKLERTCRQCISIRRKVLYDPAKARIAWAKNKYSKPEHAEDRRLRSTYGISSRFRVFMSRKQSGLCAICSCDCKLVVDHDHISGTVRGLLCNRCNLALGGFDDDIEKVRSAHRYLSDYYDKERTEFE